MQSSVSMSNWHATFTVSPLSPLLSISLKSSERIGYQHHGSFVWFVNFSTRSTTNLCSKPFRSEMQVESRWQKRIDHNLTFLPHSSVGSNNGKQSNGKRFWVVKPFVLCYHVCYKPFGAYENLPTICSIDLPHVLLGKINSDLIDREFVVLRQLAGANFYLSMCQFIEG